MRLAGRNRHGVTAKGLSDWLDVGCEGVRGVQDDSRLLCWLSEWMLLPPAEGGP